LLDDAHKGKHWETGNRLVNLPKKVELVGILPWAHAIGMLTGLETSSFFHYFRK
jgi:hypothetical protein